MSENPIKDAIFAYSEWLDSEGLVKSDSGPGADDRTHEVLTDEFLALRKGTVNVSNGDNSTPVNKAATIDTTWQQMEQRREALGLAVSLAATRQYDEDQVVTAAEKYRAFLAGETAKTEEVKAPTDPGFYKYSGGRDVLVFLLRPDGQWYTWFDNGEAHECAWGYIEQALGVWDLVKI